MRIDPFSVFNFSSLRGLNWFEGLKRIKVFLQWLWGVPAILVGVSLLSSAGNAYERFGIMLFVGLPLLGFELAFRAIVWIVAGFLKAEEGSPKTFIKAAQDQSSEEIKKKVVKWWSELKKTKTREILWAVFMLSWLYLVITFLEFIKVDPFSHWQESGFSFSVKELFSKGAPRKEPLGFAQEIRMAWYIILSLLKGLLALVIYFYGLFVYSNIEEEILDRQKTREKLSS